MNKRVAKKKWKKVLETMKHSRSTGIGVAIINQIYVDENGKTCAKTEPGARLIYLKRPKIRYFRSEDKPYIVTDSKGSAVNYSDIEYPSSSQHNEARRKKV